MRFLAIASILVSLGLGAASLGATVAADSGIVGVVRLAPQCQPTIRACVQPRESVTIRVLRPTTGKLVATVQPGRLGSFRIALPGGRYVLEGISASGETLFGRRPVRVRPHAFTLVLLTSGARLR